MRSCPGTVSVAVFAALLAVAGRRARADSVDDLIRTLATSDSYKVRVQVCLALGKKGDRRAVPILLGAVRDDHRTVRLVASQALGKIGDSAALDTLQAALRDPDEGVRTQAQAAILAIQRAGPGTRPPPSSGAARIYINVGPLANRSRWGGTDVVRTFREYLVGELRRTPGVTLDGGMQRGQTGYYIDGNIVRLQATPAGSFNEISCDLKVLVATWPGKSIIMWTDGGATVQVGHSAAQEAAGTRDCLEAAVQSVRENIATFLKAQR